MKRKLTLEQRQALQKAACLALSVVMFISSVFAVPSIIGALPRIGGTAVKDILYGSTAKAETVPTFAFGAGEFGESADETSLDQASSLPEETTEESIPKEPVAEDPVPVPIPEEGDLYVTASNLCWYEIGESATLNMNNGTKYSVDIADYLLREFPIKGSLSEDGPLVLIMHTHGSESYLPAGYDFYSPDEGFRSQDESRTVVHIGEVLCDRLNELGINTVHDKTMYDIESFNDAYYNAYDGIKSALEKYPSIKFVIDLHRDSVFDDEGNNVKPLTTINGEDCAQVMLVIGTDAGGANHPNWRDNLTFGTYLLDKMNELYPTLSRPLNLRSSGFNQALTKGSIILEVGSCGNNVEEAENAILNFAEAYAELLKEHLPE